MQVSLKYGIAFLCMPKCASHSIEPFIAKHSIASLRGPRLRHLTAYQFARYMRPLIDSPNARVELFCLMRNPLDWVKSWYKYRSRDEIKDKRHPNHENYTGNMSFDEFAIEYIYGKHKNLRKQSDYLLLADGTIGADTIIQFERMDLVESFLQEKIGEKVSIPKKNVSPQANTELSSRMEKELREYLKKDLTIYNNVAKFGIYKSSSNIISS